MNRIHLIIIVSLLTFVLYGQSATTIIKQFKADSLPICISYSHDEQVYFGAIYRTDTTDGEVQDVYETNDKYLKDISLLLSKEFVKKHLLPNAKFICKLDDRSKDTLCQEPIDDYLNSAFYAISSLKTKQNFYLVLYERVFVSSLLSSEKFICTFSKNGKFLSRALIASFVYSGTGMSNSGARVPWFPEESGCINKDMTIKFTSQNDKAKKYKIKNDGKIVETK